MQAVKSIALQAASDAGRQIQKQIAWFYLRHLGGAGVSPSAAFHSLLTRGERMALPEPQGERERVVRAHPCTRSALLEAQFYDTINAYTGQFVMSDSRVPQALRRKMNERLALFAAQTTDTVTDRFAVCIRRGDTAGQTARELTQSFEKAAKRLAGDIETCYTQTSWYHVLRQYAADGCERFRYVIEQTGGTCGACLSQSGKTYTLEQLVQLDLLPPLHPNCRCAVVPDTGAALPSGGQEEGRWFDALLRIPSDAVTLLKGFVSAQQKRLSQEALTGLLDWLAMGMVSGIGNGLSERYDRLREQPSLYHAVNWLTMGTADLVRGAVRPDEPLSLEHVRLALLRLRWAYGRWLRLPALPQRGSWRTTPQSSPLMRNPVWIRQRSVRS